MTKREKRKQWVENILAKTFFKRNFYHPSFSGKNAFKQITAPMPDEASYLQKREKARKSKPGKPGMQAMFEEALLTREQEFHLFRKLNYLRWKVRQLLKQVDENTSASEIDKIRRLYKKGIEVRNQLTLCNTRLAASTLRKIQYMGEFVDDVSSNLNLVVMRAVVFFNPFLGNKFSTYASWAISRWMPREIQMRQKDLSLASLEGTKVYDNDPGYYLRMENKNLRDKKLIKKLLSVLENDPNPTSQREMIAVMETYGLTSEPKLLREIGDQLKISKERVRQLREQGLNRLREYAQKCGIKYDDEYGYENN